MEKPRMSFWQIWNMSFGFFGIQFGWGLQMANMSAIYQYLGAKDADIAPLWVAAPLTGLIVQPIVGYFSDRTWGKLGRRRPYFLVGAILASLALIAMPNSGTVWMAAGLLWILDASINITMEPFRAFVGDLLPKEQRKSGFAVQSLLIGLGAVLSSALPFVLTNALGVGKEATVESAIPPAVRFAFYIGSAVFFAAVLYTILTTKEYPPEDLGRFQKLKEQSGGLVHAVREIFSGITSMPKAMQQLAMVQFFTWFALFCMWLYFSPAVGKGVFHGTPLGGNGSLQTELKGVAGKPYLSEAAAIARAYEAQKKDITDASNRNASPQPYYHKALQMFGLEPAAPDASERIGEDALRGLISAHAGESREVTGTEAESPLVQTFAAALMRHGVALPNSQSIGAAAAEIHNDLASARAYEEGAAWGGVCFSVYNGTAFLFAFLLLVLVRKFAARTIHRISLLCGGCGLILAFVFPQQYLLIGSMVLVGIAWASILSMPYAMLSNAIPAQKMGFYMGVFNFFIVIPQILAALGLGPLLRHLPSANPMNAVLLGGCSMVLAALSVSFVSKDVDNFTATSYSPEEPGKENGVGAAVAARK